MTRMIWLSALVLVVSLGLMGALSHGAEATPAELRAHAKTLYAQGNYKDAFDIYSKLALDANDDTAELPNDFKMADQALKALGREAETDDFREAVAAAHPKQWRLLETVAQTYHDDPYYYGYVIAGKFYRGNHRGGDGKFVNTMERDRTRSLQLMQQAMDNSGDEAKKNDLAAFYLAYAEMLANGRNGLNAWRLQYLTDLTKLPDFADGWPSYGADGGRGAPVDEQGNAVFHHIPKAWNQAATDGERWRWCLMQAQELDAQVGQHARFEFADFLHNQFGVQTMAYYGSFFRDTGDDKKNDSGPFEVSTLGEDETIAKTATGIKRFKLPAEFNYILIYQGLGAEAGHSTWTEQSLEALAHLFEDRQQYDRSAEYWKKLIFAFGPGNQNYRQKSLDQILNNWGQFEATETQSAGKNSALLYRFRNGSKVHFEAYAIDVNKLLEDVKTYLKSNPRQLQWEKVNVENIGYRLVMENQKQYLAQKPETWDQDLQPREKHFDRIANVETPLKKAGAYLVKAQMQDGNTSQIVLWVADAVILKKQLDSGSYCYVADAVSGAPIGKATVDFFGFAQRWQKDNNYSVDTDEFADFTDADGQVKTHNKNKENEFQWLITAVTADGRMAYLGFTNIWGGAMVDYDHEYNTTRVFVITDRPVYRPGQTVKFKVWINHAKYDLEGKSAFVGTAQEIKISNPKNEEVLKKGFTADDFGGFDGEYALPKDATLGVYNIFHPNFGGGTFRVEEYKKPEFEVKVDAPAEPVSLGDKITATVSAKYYFGAPVTQAKVKYKVLRSTYSATWFPAGRWDWFYEPGYWWFAADYDWYPGFNHWGMRGPVMWWWNRPQAQPELVSDNEIPIGPDGTAKIEIDTSLAKLIQGDQDHKYSITAEVTDDSRRTIVGTGEVLVSRKPFQVYAWVDRGYYQSGDQINASFCAQSLDHKPVKAKGELKLLKIAYVHPPVAVKKNLGPIPLDMTRVVPQETPVQTWALDTDDQGHAKQTIKAAEPGEYRLSYTVTDVKGNAIEGGYLFTVRDGDFTGKDFRFNDIELITDKREYQAGDKVKLEINTNQADSTVLLFVRPSNGLYLPPEVVHLNGKSTVREIEVGRKDMPNFFVEAETISNSHVFSDTREIIVPPESRVINVAVTPSAEKFLPGQKAKFTVKLTDSTGEPFVGSTVLSIYDKSVDYISGGSNVPEIKEFFWKWRRSHYPQTISSLDGLSGPIVWPNDTGMLSLGVFGDLVAHDETTGKEEKGADGAMTGAPMAANAAFGRRGGGAEFRSAKLDIAGLEQDASDRDGDALVQAGVPALEAQQAIGGGGEHGGGTAPAPLVEPTIRKNFADTALWVANLTTDKTGATEVELPMPENLTTWSAKVWAMGAGTRVGQGEADVVTYKNLLVRLQAPRFFVQTDQVVLSANVHNYLKTSKDVQVKLELEGGTLGPMAISAIPSDGIWRLEKTVKVDPNSEKRVDFMVNVMQPGSATVRMLALTDEESDATQMDFPVYVHGMLKTDSYSGFMARDVKNASLTINIPAQRKPEQSLIEVRYSPSVATAMVDALPYLADYPYGSTDETLNRFLPAVLTQKILLDMHLDLTDIQKKRTDLNAQEIGDDKVRATDWKRMAAYYPQMGERNPVFDNDVIRQMVKDGVSHLTNMQLSDGGWGWFSGWGEYSSPHTTAYVVHGLQMAKANDVAIPPNVLERGIDWLLKYQAEQVRLIKNAAAKVEPNKDHADEMDAFVYMVLADADHKDNDMNEFLYRDRTKLAVYAKTMYGLALEKQKDKEKLDMILQNISQYFVQDNEDQTAYLKLPEDNYWWCWYGSEFEAQAYYLKLLSHVDPKGQNASRLAKYLINNRKHATYWNSTRDTAICVEALADFVRSSGEDKPNLNLQVLLDGRKVKDVQINAGNLFSYDNKFVLAGLDVTTGEHKIEFVKDGDSPLYYNAYVSNFTLENSIKKAGLEIKVNRKYYKLVPVNASIKAEGSHGQAVDQRVEKYKRQELADLSTLKSGDLAEVELEIDSKNDYEYIMFDDMKPAGFEPVDIRSGYNGNDLNAYMELHDERVVFFARTLARGKHSVSYRLRAEIPGHFSALPAKVSAVYAPELRGNSDEIKLNVED